MIIDGNNRFVTQRTYGEIVLIYTAINNQQLILSHNQTPDLAPLIIEIAAPPATPAFDAVIWKDACQVLDDSSAANDWHHSTWGIKKPTISTYSKHAAPDLIS
ncbi:MAG: hypothetical protein ACI8VC_002224 [Candidatus Endobugula sp.]|jgi:uncharacterized protein YcbX